MGLAKDCELPTCPDWQTADVSAHGFAPGGGDAETASSPGHVYVPPAQEVVPIDPDGNLFRDGCWSYPRDGENRLASMETTTAHGQLLIAKSSFRPIRKISPG